MKKALLSIAFGLTASLLATGASAQATLTSVKQKGFLTCGSNTGLAGFGVPDAQGNWTGLDVEFCRAIAAAIFDDPNKVRFIPLAAKDRFTALQSGEVDVLSRNSTATMSRDTQLGLDFPTINYFDGQGFMVRKKLGVSSAKELNGASICTQQGTTTELNLADYFRANNIRMTPVLIERPDEFVAAYNAGRCDAMTQDASQLASYRATALANPDDHVVLPERISKEPLGPMVRHGDDQWLDIVKWVLAGLVEAEEQGITQANVEERLRDPNPAVQRMLGVTPGFGRALGLDERWLFNAVRAVGNYGESFERHLGRGSAIGLPRGMNDLWTRGGLMYAWPMR